MIPITNITDARANLKKLIQQSAQTPVVIVQNSRPTAMLVSYEAFLRQQNGEVDDYFQLVSQSPSYTDFGLDQEPFEHEYTLEDGVSLS